jgi:hypothetical protein
LLAALSLIAIAWIVIASIDRADEPVVAGAPATVSEIYEDPGAWFGRMIAASGLVGAVENDGFWLEGGAPGVRTNGAGAPGGAG